MNKTIIININSIVFHIEEDAYEILRTYMIDIKKHFGNSKDSNEILQDIENRIAEMFSERIQTGRKEVISIQDVEDIIAQMGRVSDFETAEEETAYTHQQAHMGDQPSISYEKKLMRNPDDKILGGVCSGLGYYFGMEAKWVRILFVLCFLFAGTGILLYVVLWAVMPLATNRADRMVLRGEEPNLQNFKKSFEEDINNDFSNAKKYVSRGAETVGTGITSFIRLIGRIVGFIALVLSGMTIIGMLITWVGFITGILGYQSDMVFPGTEIFPTKQALLALTAGVVAITIPFIALFHILVRLLFKTRAMNSYLSLSLWALWIVSIISVVVFSFMGIREFKESSTIKVERPLQAVAEYHFIEKDIRVIEASGIEDGKKKFQIELNGEDLSSYLRSDINIRFESLDSLAKPYIQYNYKAKGKTFQRASTRASNIQYEAKQIDDRIIFNSHFALQPGEKYRDQSVSIIVYLPVGAKVTLERDIANKMWDLRYHDCENNYGSTERMKSTSWIMKENGLVCAVSKKIKAEEDIPDIIMDDIVEPQIPTELNDM